MFNKSLTIDKNELYSYSIPEPTRSLVYITNESILKINNPTQIKIVISFSNKDKENDFFSEPSLIWTKLSVEKNNDLETEKIYYPTYATLSPKCRYQYLMWLKY